MAWYWVFLLGVAASPFVVLIALIVLGAIGALVGATVMRIMDWIL